LGFVSVLDFFGDFVSSNTGETSKPELKPFLTILGTRMRAIDLGLFLAERISESKQLTLTGRNAKSSLQTEAHFRTYLIETLLDAGVSSACARVKCMKTANSRVHS